MPFRSNKLVPVAVTRTLRSLSAAFVESGVGNPLRPQAASARSGAWAVLLSLGGPVCGGDCQDEASAELAVLDCE